MKTALEAVLQAMVTGGWANESDGNVEAPTGHFARVSNSAAEMMEVCQAFADEIAMHGLTCEDAHALLIGDFLVREDSQGNVFVTAYDNPIALTRDFQALQDAYALWDEE